MGHEDYKILVLPIPTAEEVIDLRKTIKRLKAPKLTGGLEGSNTRVGRFKTATEPKGVRVEWSLVDGPMRSALFADMNNGTSLEQARLEFGWMMANIWRIEGIRMLHTIPGPAESMREARPFFREEARWRCWAMLGSTASSRKKVNRSA